MIIKRIKQLQLINRNRAWLKSPISHYEKVIYYPSAATAFLLAIFRKNDYRIRYLGSNFYYDNFYAPLSLQAYPHEIGNILDNVDKNIKHVLDIGGNVGQFSKTLSHIHKEVKIDIFEPNMKIYPYLQKNLKHNKKIRLWNVGIGPAKKSMKLNFENGKSATGSFIEANASNSAGAKLERIPVSLISDPAQLTRRKNYDLVKIDVEGYEYEALKCLGKNNIVLTHGDTLTTWWGALLGKLNRCKVMHVEAGLRSFNLLKPFPEEINRLITFRLSDVYACPGDWAVENLKKYKGEKINTKENTQMDVLRFGLQNCDEAELGFKLQRPYVVASLHRYENIFNEDRFTEIIYRTQDIAKDFHVYWVQHPATKEQLNKFPELKKQLTNNKNVTLLPRLEYLQFIKLVKESEFVITDGGGNQEELYHMGKPTLLFRDETEREEGLDATAVISKLDEGTIKKFMKNYKDYIKPAFQKTATPSLMIATYLKEHNYG